LKFKGHLSAQGGIRSREGTYQQVQADTISSEVSGVSPEPANAGCSPVEFDCSNVVNAPLAGRLNEVAEQLSAARAEWLCGADEKNLRAALLDILKRLG